MEGKEEGGGGRRGGREGGKGGGIGMTGEEGWRERRRGGRERGGVLVAPTRVTLKSIKWFGTESSAHLPILQASCVQ